MVRTEAFRKLQVVQEELQLPTRGRESEVVAVGSSGLAVRNIRPARDVDLLVTPSLFDALALRFEPEIEEFPRMIIPIFDQKTGTWIEVDAFKPLGPYSKYVPTRDIFNSASPFMHEGIPIVGLHELGSLKEGMASEFDREKDKTDIPQIKLYLKKIGKRGTIYSR